MSDSPRVTVLMAAYNAEAFIANAIESVRRQTCRDWELIVIDDCSSDQTRAVVRNYARQDGRIQLVEMAHNSGPAAARNAGLAQARGQWVTILDSDDRFEADRLRYLLEQGEKHEADIVADNIRYYDAAAQKAVRNAFAITHKYLPLTVHRLVGNDGPPRRFGCGLLKPFIRRQFWSHAQVCYDETQRVGEDFLLLFTLIRKGAKAVLVARVGYIYTMPFGELSKAVSPASRTDYHGRGWDRLIHLNATIRQQVMTETPEDTKLIAMLNAREKHFIREKNWNDAKLFFRKKNIMSFFRAALQANLIVHAVIRVAYRMKGTLSIS
jgi:succinoglycan biosynthesis protein ExoO